MSPSSFVVSCSSFSIVLLFCLVRVVSGGVGGGGVGFRVCGLVGCGGGGGGGGDSQMLYTSASVFITCVGVAVMMSCCRG